MYFVTCYKNTCLHLQVIFARMSIFMVHQMDSLQLNGRIFTEQYLENY